MRTLSVACVALLLWAISSGIAQNAPVPGHEGMSHEGHTGTAATPPPNTGTDHTGHTGHMEGMGAGNHGAAASEMEPHASGTSLLPRTTPMYGFAERQGAWDVMWHGVAHLGGTDMSGPRGSSKLFSTNSIMGVAHKANGLRDALQVAGMFSLEPLTVGGSGYPLLFQSGETWNGVALRDRQHPHNLFSELSVRYDHHLGPDRSVFVYLAPVGEPALGPTAFVHRMVFLDDPLAPIGHHWQDSAHISFGVATIGYRAGRWQAEASTFNGREPGELRYQIKSPEFDSFSGHISLLPNDEWALQASYGYAHSPESLHPDENLHRLTASATFNRALAGGRNLAATLAWGRNHSGGTDEDSFLLEAGYKRDGGLTPFLRFEQVDKSAEELSLPPLFAPDRAFTLRQISLGATRDIASGGGYQWAVGGVAVLSLTPDALEPVYDRNPLGFMVYVRAHPQRMHGGH